jgi:hypothetical protein
MAFPRESVEQHRGVIPRRVRVVAQSCGGRALNARTREQEQGRRRVAALERGGPRPRGRSALGRGEPHPRGRPTLERGGPHPRGHPDLERGGPRPRGRLALERGGPRPRGHSAVPPWRAAGATRVVIVSCTYFRFMS